MKFPLSALSMLILGLSHSSMANLAIDINAQSQTPSIKKEGGVLEVTKTLSNTSNEPKLVTVYSHVVYPDGQVFVDGFPTELTLNSGESFEDGNTLLNVPATFPRGDYRYYYNVYNQQTSEIFSDYVSFEKKSEVIDVSVSMSIACGTDKTGSLCWDMKTGETLQPTPEPIFDIDYVAINHEGGCAIVDKQVRCWQTKISRTGTTSHWTDPTGVTFTDPKKIFINLSADYACTIDSGDIVCWSRSTRRAWPTTNTFVAPPNYKDLRNPSDIQVGKAVACIRHDDGVDCWGAKRYLNKPTIVEQTPKFTNPTHLVVSHSYACASGDEGAQCWGRVHAHMSMPELQPHTWLKAYRTSTVVSIDERGAFLWNTPYPRYNAFEIPELQNPVKVDYDQGGFCALEDRGIVCSGGYQNSAKETVPSRFKY